MIYKAKDYTSLLGLKGFSRELLKNHFKLYEGYVKNANKQLETPGGSQRLAFELNGIKLHEYYFENMRQGAPVELDEKSALYRKLVQEFGSYQSWEKSFRAVASMRGVGWAVAIYDPKVGLVLNTWISEHHIGHVAGTVPLLVLDLWEHAMLLDYGSDRKKYIDAFFNVIHWATVCARFEEWGKF